MKLKLSYFLTLGAAVCLSVMRFFQYQWNIETSTGFFHEIDASVYILYGVIIAVMLFGALCCFVLCRGHGYNTDAAFKSKSVSIAAIAFGGVAAVYSVISMFAANNGAGKIYELFLHLTGAAAGMAILVLGLIALRKGRSIKALPFVITAWFLFRLIAFYLFHTTVLTISENLLYILSLMFTILFWIYYGSVYANAETKKCAPFMFFFALCTVLFGTVNSLGVIIAGLGGQILDAGGFMWYLEPIVNLCSAVFTAVCAGSAILNKKDYALPEQPEEDINNNDTPVSSDDGDKPADAEAYTEAEAADEE